MTPAARLSAAIEVLSDIALRRRPSADALKDWGLSHRFAGSKDRAAIASLVYDALRRKASAAWIMGEEAGEGSARAVLLGTLRLARQMQPDAIAALCSGERFAPEPLSETERACLDAASLADAPAHVAGDVPEWLAPSLETVLGEDLVPELQAMAERAAIDLRANTLKSERDAVQEELAHLGPIHTPWSPDGLRIALGTDGRAPPIQAEPSFLKGAFEIQDEGSQLAARIAGAEPGQQVVDLCAGGGGKTLALASLMQNKGQIFATDRDLRRLAPIHDRLQRAGVRNVQVRSPRGAADPVADLDGEIDLVLVDAPCTGTGTWRRNPDSKWRVRPGSLQQRRQDQAAVLDRAARLVKAGGRIAYITCSLLPEENDEAIAGLLERAAGFSPEPVPHLLGAAGLARLADHVRTTVHGLQMSPLKTGTDGFYVAVLRRQG